MVRGSECPASATLVATVLGQVKLEATRSRRSLHPSFATNCVALTGRTPGVTLQVAPFSASASGSRDAGCGFLDVERRYAVAPAVAVSAACCDVDITLSR
ncbi:hypothetical protein CGRA01v4_05491 [Colletotrichum graminicola]|nr:hypothetical protein CGRA01v4_05491 [Colletotrichum graminicola]